MMEWWMYLTGVFAGIFAAPVAFGLAAWLGKIWANRILEKDRAKYRAQVEALLADLRVASLMSSFTIRSRSAGNSSSHTGSSFPRVPRTSSSVGPPSPTDSSWASISRTWATSAQTHTQFHTDWLSGLTYAVTISYGYFSKLLIPSRLAECRDGCPQRLRAICHLLEAEDESQEWPGLPARFTS